MQKKIKKYENEHKFMILRSDQRFQIFQKITQRSHVAES